MNPVHADHRRNLDGKIVHSVALGTYLGEADTATDQKAVRVIQNAFPLGLNFIDTAINYRCMRSERSIGKALQELLKEGKIAREDVFISTKGGYIPCDEIVDPDISSLIERDYIRKGFAEWDDIVDGCHCMAPHFLRSQIERSRKNLRLETIDLYYLHNPETQLAALGPDVFYERLKAAFEVLEDAVAVKKIGRYGLATWSAFREKPNAPGLIQLEKCFEIAKGVGGNGHHLKAIQLPYNLASPEAALLRNQEGNSHLMTVLEAASLMGVSVLTSVPLLQGRLTANFPPALKQILGMETDSQRAIRFVVSTPGITAAMVGMKEISHLEENLQVLRQPALSKEEIARLLRP